MNKSGPYPLEFGHRNVWLPRVIWACTVICGLPVSQSPKLHLGWRASLSTSLILQSEGFCALLFHKTLRLTELK